MKKIITFNLKFSQKDKRYIKTMIFCDKETMYKFYQEQLKITDQKGKNDFEAMFQPYEMLLILKDKEKKLNKIGNLLLYKDRLGSGLITHECGHATFHYWRLNHVSPLVKKGQEEDFLYILGFIVADFWRNYFKNEKLINNL
jgi:hypothetical protein